MTKKVVESTKDTLVPPLEEEGGKALTVAGSRSLAVLEPDERTDRRAMKALDRAFDALKNYGTRRRQTDPAGHNSGDMFMTLGQAQSFIAVALNEGKALVDLGEITGTPQSTLSRHLLDLGMQDRNRKAGFGLVDSRTDPWELRRKLYTLTPKGKQLKAQLVKILED